MDVSHGRVFINPNFNKGAAMNGPIRHVNGMHFNRNFQQATNMQSVNVIPKSKIFINPNFIRPNNFSYQVQSSLSTKITHPNPKHQIYINTQTIPTLATNLIVHKPTSGPPNSLQTNSRYSLVRKHKQGESNSLTENKLNIQPSSATVKISKYKSIKLTDVKKKLETVRPFEKKSILNKPTQHCVGKQNKYVVLRSPSVQVNKYKVVRNISSIVRRPSLKRHLSINAKKALVSKIRLKSVTFKTNNVPCPQFRKYGRCLRKTYGKCEYVHDKKHVAICRKFINGVCHDNECLLSHEFTAKKMPTCYFYLKGMCIREGCPYLHVKLSDKVKNCSEFLKGYCERGDKCLKRHVQRSLQIDHVHSQTPQKFVKIRIDKSKIKTKGPQRSKSNSTIDQQTSAQEKRTSESRYYKESIQESNLSADLELIKPTRCKLGTLPSFIQL